MAQLPQHLHSGKALGPAGLHFARLKGWTAQLWQRRPVEARATLSVPAEVRRKTAPQRFSPSEREFLLELARNSVAAVVRQGGLPDPGPVPPRLAEDGLSFVTLTAAGLLRGCVGHLLPKPLFKGVMENARGAACRDPRFTPVQPEEVPALSIEISVLTEPRKVTFQNPEELLAVLRPGEDGVLLQAGARLATFLPQVWAQIPDKVLFLEHLSLKAGCSASAWRDHESVLSVYQVECFSAEGRTHV